MIKAIIIDDEEKGRVVLKQKLADHCPSVLVVCEASNGEEGKVAILEHHPDLVFLDIEMPRMNGFEMLNNLSEKNFHLIFTTAYDHYAIKAIKYAAFDYLLKPIDIEELKVAVNKISEPKNSNTKSQVEQLQENIKNPLLSLNKLAIPTIDGLNFYNITEIVLFEANSNYTYLHFYDGKKVLASRTLKEFEELLPEETFFRPHHSHIVNINYISRYIKGEGGQIVLSNGMTVDVSRRKKMNLMKMIGQF